MMLTRRSLGPLFLAVVLCAMASFTTSRSRAAPAAQQPGDVTQSDDFSDPSRGVLPRSVNNDQFTVAVEDGEYVIRKPEGTNNGRPVVRPAPGRDYADASIAFDARLVGQTNDRFLTAGCRRPATGPGGYMTFVNPRYQWIDIYRSDGPGQLTGLVSQWSSAVVHDRLMHRYEFLCVGDTVAVRVDGAIAAWVQDATFTSGRFEVGVGLNDARQAVEGRLDNLAVTFAPAAVEGPNPAPTPGTTLYAENFAEPEQAIIDPDNRRIGIYTAAVEDHSFVIRMPARDDNRYAVTRLPGTFADSSVTMESALLDATAGRWLYESCRFTSSRAGNSAYHLYIYPRVQGYSLEREVNGAFTMLASGYGLPAVNRGHTSNNIELTCVGDNIVVRVNSFVLTSIHDNALTSGANYVGVGSTEVDLSASARITSVAVVIAPTVPTGAPFVPPPGTVLFSDDFGDPDDGLLPVSTFGDTKREYVLGEYVMQLRATQRSFFRTMLPAPVADAIVAIDARYDGDVDPLAGISYGVGCRRTGSGTGYAVSITPGSGGVWELGRYGPSGYVRLASGRSTAFQAISQANRIELACAGSTIAVRVNGESLATVTDGTYSSGQPWLEIIGTGLVKARFDNLAVIQQ